MGVGTFVHHFTLILLLHYLVKCRSRNLAVYNNGFILACFSSENHRGHKFTKSLKIQVAGFFVTWDM